MNGPLDGVRIIDLTTAVLGPLTTQILGDLGADVIKVEPPEGDAMRFLGASRNAGMSAMFLTNNRNKRSMVLDLKRPKAREALHHLARTADVFFHNMRPKAAERLGMDYARIAEANPSIVYASATGFARNGGHDDKPAFDDVIEGWSGIPSLFIKSGKEAQYAPFAAADKVVAYTSALAIGMALFHRQRTGEGQEVHIPMLETMVGFNLHEHLWGSVFEPPATPIGYARMGTPHRRPFETRDGHICVMPSTDAQWSRMLLALDRPDLAADERFAKMAHRGGNFDELYGQVREELKKRPTKEWLALLEASDIPCGPAMSMDDLMTDEYFVATEFFKRFDHPSEGRLVATAQPIYFSRTKEGPHPRLPQPRLGEHTRSILGELGLSAEEVEEVIGTEGDETRGRSVLPGME